MEASDVFATPATRPQEIGEDDPFAGTDFGDVDLGSDPSTAAEPERPVPEATTELPTVDREGVVQTPGGVQDAIAEETVLPAQALPEPEPEPEPVPPPQVGPTPEAKAALDAISDAGRPTPDPTPPAESAGPTEAATPDPEPEPDPTPASSEPSPAAAADDAGAEPEPEPEPVAEPGDAPPPPELRDSGGRTTHRRYQILKPLGNGRFDTVYWWVDRDGNMVPQGTRGAKRQKFALCRSQEDALKVGYVAIGAPPKATLVAVAVSSFQERTIEPDPPKPERARLKIS